jgi:hypothetical protein
MQCCHCLQDVLLSVKCRHCHPAQNKHTSPSQAAYDWVDGMLTEQKYWYQKRHSKGHLKEEVGLSALQALGHFGAE